MFRSILPIAAIVLMTAGATAAQTTREHQSGQTAAPALNLNTATQNELEKLPGVGPATAKLILEYRQKNNGFKKVEELMNIKGIGEKSFLKLKPLVTVSAAKSGGQLRG